MSTCERPSILFLCTGNSARSILAEAIANQRFGMTVRAMSAGSDPKGRPHPLALEALERRGLAVDRLQSQSWGAYLRERFDLVITLCDAAARETCPAFPGAPPSVHWGLPDPPAAPDPAAAFDRTFDALVAAMTRLSETTPVDLVERARIAARYVEQVGATG